MGYIEPTHSRASGFLFSLIWRHPRLLAIITVLAVLSALVTAPTPYLGMIIIDDLIFRSMGAVQGGRDVSGFFGVPHVVWALAGVVACGFTLKLLGGLILGWQSHYILQITRNILHEVRLDASLRVMGAPQSYFETNEPGRIASRLVMDVYNMDGAIFTILRNLLPAVVTVLVVTAFMLFINPMLTLVVMITLPVTAVLTWASWRKLHTFSKEESDRSATLNATSTEIFGAIKIIRSFTAEPYFLDRLRGKAEACRFEGIRHWTVFHAIAQMLGIFSSIGADIFLFVGGVMAVYGTITFGEFFAFYGYQAMLWGPINMLLNSGVTIQQGSACADKVHDLLVVDQEQYLLRETTSATEPPPFRGEVRAEQLVFAYNGGDPVLQGIDLHIKPGTMTALVGHSGSGKTTFASLLLGLYMPTGGRLLVDGTELRQWDLRQLRRNIGVVLQDAVLFNDTIRDNLCMGRDYTDEQVWQALKAASLDDVVVQLPDGLLSMVGVNGTRLSGGQKQRIAIARVFLKNPSFLILDEATSALDSETEKVIQASFDGLMHGRTSVVIAHRLSTIYRADQIAVMHQGRIMEVGTHDQLICRGTGHYRRLYEAQVEGMMPMSGPHRTPWTASKGAP